MPGVQQSVPAIRRQQERFPFRAPLIRGMAREQTVQDGPQAVDIGGWPHRAQARTEPGLFGSHVLGRADHHARFG